MWFGLSTKVNKIPEYQRNTGMTASRNHMILKHARHTQFLKVLTQKIIQAKTMYIKSIKIFLKYKL